MLFADFESNPIESSLTCGVIAHYCSCCGDTFASEIGILSKSKPILITAPWRKVPNGTNGGVSLWGTLWSAIGGALIGVGCVLLDSCSGMDIQFIKMILFSSLSGLLGSFLDSLLGATLQATYYDDDKKLVYCEKEDAPANANCINGINCLTNAQVNFFSVLATTLIGGFYLAPAIFS